MDLETITVIHATGIRGASGLVASADSVSITNICVDMAISLFTPNNITEVGGVVGIFSPAGGSGPDVIQNASVRGSITADTGGSEITSMSNYVGVVVADSTHTNVVSNMDVTITNSSSSPGFHYGGMMNNNFGGIAFTNVLQYGVHTIAVGMSNPGGIFTFLGSSPVTSVYHVNEPAYGGLPAATDGPGAIVEDTYANFQSRLNANYTGFDFTNVWQRDPVTSMPELQYCP